MLSNTALITSAMEDDNIISQLEISKRELEEKIPNLILKVKSISYSELIYSEILAARRSYILQKALTGYGFVSDDNWSPYSNFDEFIMPLRNRNYLIASGYFGKDFYQGNSQIELQVGTLNAITWLACALAKRNETPYSFREMESKFWTSNHCMKNSAIILGAVATATVIYNYTTKNTL